MHDGRPSLARKVKKKPGKEIKPSEQSSKRLPLLNKESAKTQLNTARAVLINQVKIGRLTFSSGEEGFFLNSIDSLFSKGLFISFCGVSALRKLLGIGHGSISPGGWAKQHPETEGGATGRDLARYVENANAGVRLHNVEKGRHQRAYPGVHVGALWYVDRPRPLFVIVLFCCQHGTVK